MGHDGQTEEQEKVSQHHVEKEDIVGVGLPELELEDEEMEHRCIQRQSQDENHNHDSCVELIQRLVCDITVFDWLKRCAGICYLNGHFPANEGKKYSSLTPQTEPKKFLSFLPF